MPEDCRDHNPPCAAGHKSHDSPRDGHSAVMVGNEVKPLVKGKLVFGQKPRFRVTVDDGGLGPRKETRPFKPSDGSSQMLAPYPAR